MPPTTRLGRWWCGEVVSSNDGAAGGRVTPLAPPRPDPAAFRRVWYLVPAAAVVVAGVGVVYRLLAGSVDGSNLIATLAYVEFAFVGALIGARRPGNALAWVMAGIGLGGIVNVAGFAYASWAYAASERGVLPALLLADAAFWLAGGLALGFVPMRFPDGFVPSPRWRPAGRVATVALGVVLTTSLLHPGVVEDEYPTIVNPHGVGAVQPLGLLAVLTLLVLGIVSTVGLVLRFRRSEGGQRQQMKWLALGVVILIAGVVLDQVVVPGLLGGGSLGELFQAGLTMVVPTAVGIAILRHRLLDIDVVLSRTLTYGVLTAALLVAYVIAVSVLSSPLEPARPIGPSLVATAVVAVAFAPLRQRVQRAVNRSLFGQRNDPYAVVSELGERLESTGTSEAILPTVVETVAQTLRLPYASIQIHDEANPIGATFGTPAAELVHFPLVHQAQELGSLVVAGRTRRDPLSSSDRQLLEELARLVSIVAYSVRMNSDLQRSRERLVAAREEERRRLRRDLHDGLGPSLAGVAYRVGAVQALVPTNPAAAEAQLASLRQDVKAATKEVRRLVEGLRPPALDELGLVGAIRQVAASFGDSNGPGPMGWPEVTVEAPDARRLSSLPAGVEVAAYRIVSEALTNVFRHAEAGMCRVRLTTDDALEIVVADDGKGLRSSNTGGVGIHSMRERAEELGGVCTVQSVPGVGTTVRARLPMSL